MIVWVTRGAPQQVVGDSSVSELGSIGATDNDRPSIKKFLDNCVGVASDVVFEDS